MQQNEDRALTVHADAEGARLVSRGFNDTALHDRAIKACRAACLVP